MGPVDQVAVLGDNATFHCITRSSVHSYWTINGNHYDTDHEVNRMYMHFYIDDGMTDGDFTNLTVTVQTSQSVTNSSISCSCRFCHDRTCYINRSRTAQLQTSCLGAPDDIIFTIVNIIIILSVSAANNIASLATPPDPVRITSSTVYFESSRTLFSRFWFQVKTYKLYINYYNIIFICQNTLF